MVAGCGSRVAMVGSCALKTLNWKVRVLQFAAPVTCMGTEDPSWAEVVDHAACSDDAVQLRIAVPGQLSPGMRIVHEFVGSASQTSPA